MRQFSSSPSAAVQIADIYIYCTMQAAIVHVKFYTVLLYLLHENLHTEKRIHAIMPTKWVAAMDCCELILCSRVHTAGEEKEVQYNTAVWPAVQNVLMCCCTYGHERNVYLLQQYCTDASVHPSQRFVCVSCGKGVQD